MPIIISEPTVKRGEKDAKRHREKQREAIKENLPDIIADETIITQRGDKKIKIPIKSLDIPHFRPATPKNYSKTGFGQGKGKKGKIIDKNSGNQPGKGGKGKPGGEPGVDYVETEIELEELMEMAFEDLGLPNLQQKTKQEIEVLLGYKVTGLEKIGIPPLRNRYKTSQEGIKRFWNYLAFLERETGKDELSCFRALKQADGILEDAEKILTHGVLTNSDPIEPFPIFTALDMRYSRLDQNIQLQSQAVVIAMMDVSGSMGPKKKYYSRSMLYWIVNVLRKLYQHVEIRFITHHTEAKIVDEGQFFSTGESGGTYCHSAYDAAYSLLEESYPASQWNSYVWHFSDGEDGNFQETLNSVRKLMGIVNLVSYGEVWSEEESYTPKDSRSELWNAFLDGIPCEEVSANKMPLLYNGQANFLGLRIQDKTHILPALKVFLNKNWGGEVK